MLVAEITFISRVASCSRKSSNRFADTASIHHSSVGGFTRAAMLDFHTGMTGYIVQMRATNGARCVRDFRIHKHGDESVAECTCIYRPMSFVALQWRRHASKVNTHPLPS